MTDCNWPLCKGKPNPCFAWCKCRCHHDSASRPSRGQLEADVRVLSEALDAANARAERWKKRADEARAERDKQYAAAQELAAALARVKLLVSPQWRTNTGHEFDDPSSAYAAGRNWMIDQIRAALEMLDD